MMEVENYFPYNRFFQKFLNLKSKANEKYICSCITFIYT